ncbi:hypothetical protein [Prosthecobacter sp.]|uniref:hypothetical protein n=1 Tax=Prosthecobacter sp. TaxID=1965333 RepID=UPI0037CB30F1
MTHCVISEQSLTAGMFSAQIPGNMLAELPWEYEDVITLKLDGVVKFKGVALSPKRADNGFSQNIVLRFADPWWYLSQGTYEQPWWVPGGGGAQDSAMVALFASISPGEAWLKRPISAEIPVIIEACNAYFGGGVMQMGEMLGSGFTANPIPQRMNNATFESVLRQALGWVPDAIQQWDYSTTPPTLSFVQRGEATARTYSFADNGVIVERDFMKRDDLVVRGIAITYAGLNSAGLSFRIADQAGETTGTRLLKAVIDCGGNARGAAATNPTVTPAVTRKYTVVSEAIEMTRDWWFKYGDTGALTAADIVVGDGSQMEFAPNAPENAGKDDLGGCDRQWLEGGMPKTRLSANTRVALVTGYLTVRTNKAENSDAAPITNTEIQERRTVKLLVPVTKLSGEYEQVISEASTSINGVIPQIMTGSYITPGLAAQLLASWSVPQYDGTFKLVKSECDEPVTLGDVINVTGGLIEWVDMNTQVHSLTRDIDTGTTTIQTGAAEHLGIEEYASLLPMSRLRTVVATDLDQQAMGEVPSSDPDPDELDDLVGPGAIKSSVSYGEQKIKITTSTAVHLTDMTAEAGPTISNKDTGSGDEVVTTPGKQTVQNTSSEKSNTSTPDKQSLKSGETDTAELSVADGLKLLTETKTAQLKAGILTITGEDGFSITLSATDGLVMTDSGLTLQIKPGTGMVISDGTATSTYNLLQLLHNNGSGKTNSVTDEQIVISDGGDMTVIEAGQTTVQNGTGDDVTIKPNEVRVNDGGSNYSSVSAEGGFRNIYSGNEAMMFVGSVQLDNGSGGTVDITPVPEQAISFQDTDGCDVDDAEEPITTTTKVLRGAVTPA